MIKRDITSILKEFASQYPAIAILGPRQSGKTTLARTTFPKYQYVSFEDLDKRHHAITDPRGFLKAYENVHGIILDEIQHVTSLLSYMQTYVDEHEKPGYFIVTGSQNFMVHQAAAQTMAGRIAIITLLPLSINELAASKKLPSSSEKLIFKGGYPRIYAQKLKPGPWYSFYIRMYIERDVRLITQVIDLNNFERFLALCAGRTGQILNMSSLANDCGISQSTVRAWLSILEASYIIFLLQPYYKHFNKRIIKSPKLYFYDTGLACSLLGIQSDKQLMGHYLRGALFESLVISELKKNAYDAGQSPRLYFWRDSNGHEVDVIIEKGTELLALEIKSSYTINTSFFDALNAWNEISGTEPSNNFIIYAGDEIHKRARGNVVSWSAIAKKIKQ